MARGNKNGTVLDLIVICEKADFVKLLNFVSLNQVEIAFLVSGKIDFCVCLLCMMRLLERKVQEIIRKVQEIIRDKKGFQNMAC